MVLLKRTDVRRSIHHEVGGGLCDIIIRIRIWKEFAKTQIILQKKNTNLDGIVSYQKLSEDLLVLFIFAQTLVKLRLFLPHKSTFFYNFLTHYDFLLVDLQLYIIHEIEIYPINLKKKKKRNSRSRLFCTDMRHHIPKLHAITV